MHLPLRRPRRYYIHGYTRFERCQHRAHGDHGRGVKEESMRVSVDLNVCQGHGVCYMTTPEIFEPREEDGQAHVVISGELPREREDAAVLAQQSCPERAITVE
ncbi:ferredoxin [Nonomuraea cavernae]|uniref:ferredoxin n=1 Tax=Nonomuraea cavernae TaxID=2045107 RepID=UPI0033DA5728